MNPFLLVQIIRQGVGNIILAAKRVSHDNYKNETEYKLPFKGEWFVYNGGIDPEHSHSWNVITQRYAYDFVVADRNKNRHSSDGTRLQDYLCYDRKICAAADGKVVKVVEGVRSAPFLGYGIVDFFSTNFVGNHVIIRHAEKEYGLYAHLIKGSIPLSENDFVQQGQMIGKCGHSGHSSEPHLHFHLQDRENFYRAHGIPIRFSNIAVDGEFHKRTSIREGSFVVNKEDLKT